MNIDSLKKALAGEPGFRLKQAQKAVFQDLIEDWQEASALPLSLRQKFTEVLPLQISAETLIAKDGRTVKAKIFLEDGLSIETVLMRYSDRNTVCVSSMVGCPLACEFCVTGKMGFKRNLTADEIIEQVLFFKRYLKSACPAMAKKSPLCGVVFMGMGEPFFNYDNVMAAIKILNDKNCFNIGSRHISISTVGIVEGIEKLAKETLQLNLAISLHAPDDNLRSKIMPLANKKYPLKSILVATRHYLETTNRKVMFEYIMIKGINDSLAQATELVKLLFGFKKSLYLVNLIIYNPTGIFEPSPREQIKRFRGALEKEGIEVSERYRFGRDIKGACGQLYQT